MRSAALVAACLSGGASAAAPGFGTSFTVRVIDEGGRPVAGAFVIAREFVTVPQFHGSRSSCERADVGPAAAGSFQARLPAAGLAHLSPDRSHALEALAYARGQCVERTPSAQAASYAMSLPAAMRGEVPKAVQAGQSVALRARPMAGAEERLEYLAGLSGALLACSQWSARSREGMAQLVAAIGAEAEAPAAPMAPTLAPLGSATPSRDFIVAPAGAVLRWPDTRTGLVVMAAQRGAAAQAIHCRPGTACDLDERDASGKTAIYQYAADLDVERVALLLERGADPSVAVDRFGANAIDAVIGRAVMRPPALGSIDAGKALAVIDLIAASPRAAIRASLGEQLRSDPSQWLVKSPESLAILTHAREKLAAVRTRADPASGCDRVEAGAGYETGAVRLR